MSPNLEIHSVRLLSLILGGKPFVRVNKMNNLFTITIREKYWVSLCLVGN